MAAMGLVRYRPAAELANGRKVLGGPRYQRWNRSHCTGWEGLVTVGTTGHS
jgi:hypothetical protein